MPSFHRQTPVTRGAYWASRAERNHCHLTTSHKTKVCSPSLSPFQSPPICWGTQLTEAPSALRTGEKARITAAGGFVDFGRVNGNLALSRAIGDFEFKKSAELAPEQQIVTAYPDVVVHDLGDDDEFLVLACDGKPENNDTRPRSLADPVRYRHLGLPVLSGRDRVRQAGNCCQTGFGEDLRKHDGQLPGLQLGDGWRGL